MKAMAENYTRSIQNQFYLQSDEPLMWGDQAFELIHAAEILGVAYQQAKIRHAANMFEYFKPVGDMKPIYALRLIKMVYYLYGLSIENFFKGILVAKETKPPRSHDLKELSQLSGFLTDDRRTLLLDELTAVVLWHGRYHLPLDVEKFTPRPGLRDFPSIPRELGHQELPEVIDLLGDIARAFKKEMKAFEPVRAARAAIERANLTANEEKQGLERK